MTKLTGLNIKIKFVLDKNVDKLGIFKVIYMLNLF